MQDNLNIELMQWQAHRVRGSSFDYKKNIKYSLAEEKGFGELDKM